MTLHVFLLNPNCWLGQGKLKLNMIADELVFYTRWDVGLSDAKGRIECLQEIEVKGLPDCMHNQFSLYDFKEGEFIIDLENQALGKIKGKGVINDKIIAWEFRVDDLGFDGYEFYEKVDDKNYLMRAEYATSDQFRTVIEGKIWLPK